MAARLSGSALSSWIQPDTHAGEISVSQRTGTAPRLAMVCTVPRGTGIGRAVAAARSARDVDRQAGWPAQLQHPEAGPALQADAEGEMALELVDPPHLPQRRVAGGEGARTGVGRRVRRGVLVVSPGGVDLHEQRRSALQR